MKTTRMLSLVICALACLLSTSVSEAIVAKIDRFTVIKNGSLFFEDTFSDGLPPPSAPDFAIGGAARYITTGPFGPETGGRLEVDSDRGVLFPDPIFGEIPFLIQTAMLSTNIDPSDLLRGLKIDDTFQVVGVFDLVVPTALQERYAIRVRDRSLTNTGDDELELSVRRNRAGDLRIQFRRFNYVTEVITVIASVPLETFHNQIELILTRPTTSNNLVFASFAYIDGGIRGPVTFLGSAEIFRGENFTRAGFTIQKPAVSTRFGSPGTASNPSGTFSDPVNTASGNYLFQRTDLAVPGRGFPFLFTRTYNSLDAYSGPFGRGWTHSYNVFLTENPDESVVIKHGDGRQEFYGPIGDGNFQPLVGGIFSTLVKNSDGTFSLTLKNQTRYLFSAAGKLTNITDRNGNVLFLTYDGAGNLAKITDTVGRAITLTSDVSNRISRLTDPIGRTVHYSYDIDGNLASVTDPKGDMITFAYDANHRITEIFDERGNRLVANSYDALGRVVVQTNGRGLAASFAYDSPTQDQTTITDPLGNVIIHRHDALLRLVEVTDAGGNKIRFSYDVNNNRPSITDQNGNTTLFAYDARGNVTSITDPLGNIISFTYDSNNNLTSATNARGFTTSFNYDGSGNLNRIQDALANTTAFNYDSFGQLIRKTDARGNQTKYAFDGHGNLTRIPDALGGITTLAYDGIGRLLSLRNPNGHTATSSYDLNSRLREIIDPLGNKTRFAYDPVGNLTEITDAKGGRTRYGFDEVYNLTRVTDALGHITQYAYNANSSRISLTDANGHTTLYGFDAVNRLRNIIDPLGNTTTYNYDPVGNVTSVRDANETTNIFTYDANNRLRRIDYGDGASVAYAYDNNGNRVSMNDSSGTTTYDYDELDRLIQVAHPAGAVDYGYDAVGNRIAMMYPDDSTVAYAYDPLNRLSSVNDKNGKVTEYTYDLTSNLKSTAYPNKSAILYSYDAANRLTRVENRDVKKKLISSFEYKLDVLGNRVRMTRDGKRATNYAYDALSQLVAVQERERPTKFTYDAVGNRLTMVTGKKRPTVYSYDTANRLLNAGDILYFYDANGNRIRKQDNRRVTDYVYDAANRLVQVVKDKDEVLYGYDGDGNKVTREIERSKKTERSNFINDIATALPVVLTEDAPEGFVKYVYGLGLVSQAVEERRTRRGDDDDRRKTRFSELFYHFDGLGSVMNLSDEKGREKRDYQYDPWGNARNGDGDDEREDRHSDLSDRFRFTGEEFDGDTGLYYLRARWYDPSVGRFLTKDRYQGFAGQPLSLNLYSYVRNNPVRLVDPTGYGAEERGSVARSSASLTIGSLIAPLQTVPASQAITSGPSSIRSDTGENRSNRVFDALKFICDLVLPFGPCGAGDAAIEAAENWQPVIMDLKDISQGEDPKTWGGSTFKAAKCNFDLDCIFGE
jgi:RHS repeat-associated protein